MDRMQVSRLGWHSSEEQGASQRRLVHPAAALQRAAVPVSVLCL